MAMIDYGALLKVDGIFVNKDKGLFTWYENGQVNPVVEEDDSIYFGGYVEIREPEIFISFHRTAVFIGATPYPQNRQVLRLSQGFTSETRYLPDGMGIKVSHLDEQKHPEYMEKPEPYSEWVRHSWTNATGDEKPCDLQGYKKAYRQRLKYAKRYARKKGVLWYGYKNRYLAEWDRNGHHYEVIFGNGIDPDEKVWEDIRDKNLYGYSEKEIEIINSWFGIRQPKIRKLFNGFHGEYHPVNVDWGSPMGKEM